MNNRYRWLAETSRSGMTRSYTAISSVILIRLKFFVCRFHAAPTIAWLIPAFEWADWSYKDRGFPFCRVSMCSKYYQVDTATAVFW